MGKLATFFTDKRLLKQVFVLIIGLIAFRILASIPLPFIDIGTIEAILYQNQVLGVFNIFSGGGLANLSIGMLGVFPYITVAIIFQLLTVVIPKLKSLYSEEGEIGRKKFGQMIRLFSIPVAAINAFGILAYLQSQSIIPELLVSDFISAIILVVAGSVLAMWIGELITEFGIGNGISLLILAGIAVNIPLLLTQAISTFSTSAIVLYVAVGILILIGIGISVWMNEADRPVPVTYARYGLGLSSGENRADTYIPIKVNPVGVLSMIFGLVIVAFFQYIFSFISGSEVEILSKIGEEGTIFLANGYLYSIPLAFLTFFFTYFHAPIAFDTKKISDNLKKQGGFIPGVRPGDETKEYMLKVLNNIIFYAAVFLTAIVVIPFLVTGSSQGVFLFAVGGTGILIIVSVTLDIYRKITSRIRDLQEFTKM